MVGEQVRQESGVAGVQELQNEEPRKFNNELGRFK
jgi:hypothetical protein